MTEPIRVLLIEDEPADAELVLIELKRGGFDPSWERVDTEEQLCRALAAGNWDLIISDFAMPQFDGLRAFERFRESGLDIPFIFVSGAMGEERAVAAMRAGARDYLLKGHLKRLNTAVRRELNAAEHRRRSRQAEAHARRERQRLEVALKATGAFMFDERRDGHDSYYDSHRWTRLVGHDELPDLDPAAGQSLLDWLIEHMHSSDRAGYSGLFTRYLNGADERMHINFRLRHAEGHWLHLSLYTVAAERNHERHVTRSVGLLMDRSDNALLERQLRQSQKLEEVGQLAGGIAHDFNNLLTLIISFATFAAERTDDVATTEDISEVIAAADRAQHLTGQLLAFSADRAVEPAEVSVNALANEMTRMLTRVFPSNIRVATDLEPDLWTIYTDPGGVGQVLMNLCVNARDAMPKGGLLTIRTANVNLIGGEQLDAEGRARSGDYVALSVVDTGTGIEEDVLGKLFQPFFTTKPPGKGTGLGLSTCYGIARQANGWISVCSTVGAGTTFTVWFPRADQIPAGIQRRVRRSPGRGSETVLVVDDDEKIATVVARSLNQQGYRVLQAADGGSALQLARKHHIDLVVADLMLPGVGAAELPQGLHTLQPGVAILFVSGHNFGASQQILAQYGGHVLQKPFSGEQLASRVREILDGISGGGTTEKGGIT